MMARYLGPLVVLLLLVGCATSPTPPGPSAEVIRQQDEIFARAEADRAEQLSLDRKAKLKEAEPGPYPEQYREITLIWLAYRFGLIVDDSEVDIPEPKEDVGGWRVTLHLDLDKVFRSGRYKFLLSESSAHLYEPNWEKYVEVNLLIQNSEIRKTSWNGDNFLPRDVGNILRSRVYREDAIKKIREAQQKIRELQAREKQRLKRAREIIDNDIYTYPILIDQRQRIEKRDGWRYVRTRERIEEWALSWALKVLVTPSKWMTSVVDEKRKILDGVSEFDERERAIAAYVEANPLRAAHKLDLLTRTVFIGMTRQELIMVLGYPDDSSTITTVEGARETWIYDPYIETTVVLVDDRIIEIRE